MIRTQIYIKETLHERAKTIAKRRKQSLADLYRSFIAEGLKADERHGVDLTSLANLGLKGGPKDLSSEMDEYLYGSKK